MANQTTQEEYNALMAEWGDMPYMEIPHKTWKRIQALGAELSEYTAPPGPTIGDVLKCRKPIAVFTAGGAASGKSTALRESQWAHLPVVDPDSFKPLHPDYDPKAPELVHEWSKEQAKALRLEYLAAGTSHVVDGTGAKVGSYCGRIREAREAGFEIVILWCRCSLKTGLRRNAARERTVREDIVRDQYAKIPGTMNVAKKLADLFTIIDTD